METIGGAAVRLKGWRTAKRITREEEMEEARSHQSSARRRSIRVCKSGSARDAIGSLRPGHEAFILTFGQFSAIDALMALLEQTGPAEVDVATWTAANADLDRMAQLLARAEIIKCRWLVDRSFLTRQPAYCRALRRLFGDGCIRTLRSHAKFMTIRNGQWNLAVRMSMNLNQNPRCENLEVSDDPALCGFLRSIVDEVFDECHEGDFGGGVPELRRIPEVGRSGGVAMGEIAKGLHVPRVGQ